MAGASERPLLNLQQALQIIEEHDCRDSYDTDCEAEERYWQASDYLRAYFADLDGDRSTSVLHEIRTTVSSLADRLLRGSSSPESGVGIAPPQSSPGTPKRRRNQSRSVKGSEPLSPDAFIDQWSGLVPHDLFLKLARERAFKAHRKGTLVLARWGDVREAVRQLDAAQRPTMDPEDAIRATLGLLPKGGR